MSAGSSGRVVRCVGAVVHDEAERLLVVRRAHEPSAGLWSVPGGRVEPGETDRQAVIREVREETGLVVEVDRLVGTVQRDGAAGVVYDIYDYACVPVGGALSPGTDASDARWVTPTELRTLDCSSGLVDALEQWGVIS